MDIDEVLARLADVPLNNFDLSQIEVGVMGIVDKISLLFPTHTRRSESSQSLQQFSTPVELPAFLTDDDDIGDDALDDEQLEPETFAIAAE